MNLSKLESDLVSKFYQILKDHPQSDYQELFRKDYSEEIPGEMLGPKFRDRKSSLWLPMTNTTLDLEDINQLEEKCGLKYPDIYKHWLLHSYSLLIRVDEICLYGNHPINGIDKLKQSISAKGIQKKLLPLGYHGMSLKSLVFDYNITSNTGEPTIRLFQANQESIVFSSFQKLLECFNHFLDPPPNSYPEKLFQDFMVIDPPCKSYWVETIKENNDWDSMNP